MCIYKIYIYIYPTSKSLMLLVNRPCQPLEDRFPPASWCCGSAPNLFRKALKKRNQVLGDWARNLDEHVTCTMKMKRGNTGLDMAVVRNEICVLSMAMYYAIWMPEQLQHTESLVPLPSRSDF